MGKRNNAGIIPLFVAFLSFSMYLSAQITSPFTGQKLNDSVSTYSFIVSGHFHGQSNNSSTFPAATVLSSIDTLNKLQPAFLMSLGDLFLDVDDVYLNHYKSSLFSKIKFPLLNAVGNHDLSNGNRYEKEFGKTFYSFVVASELYIVLNTELNDGSIQGEQLSFLKSTLETAQSEKIKNVFIFTHRPIWAERIDKYKQLFLENTRTAIGTNNFLEEIQPLLKPIAASKHIFWLSGSMGGGPASFFYDKNDEYNIVFIQTAIRDTPKDAMLNVKVNNGFVTLDGLSLTNQQLTAIESYNLDFWSKNTKSKPEFSFRLLPLYFKNMFLHPFFWYGAGFTFLCFISIRFVLKRRKK